MDSRKLWISTRPSCCPSTWTVPRLGCLSAPHMLRMVLFPPSEAPRSCRLHIAGNVRVRCRDSARVGAEHRIGPRSEEHTSELQSRGHLVCRLLLEKKKS